ncbi:hypothetical protein [Flagellimonas sp.]|uniref:hypothetical protein n=1 Tax=Flagellimonas sp. TaxID=2058762 RepID=UPI003BB16168
MKTYDVYRNIRKRAVIMGLPISLFALLMVSVIGSLLIIIFSFSVVVIISVLMFNIVLYLILGQITKNPSLLDFKKAFPRTIDHKKPGLAKWADNH